MSANEIKCFKSDCIYPLLCSEKLITVYWYLFKMWIIGCSFVIMISLARHWIENRTLRIKNRIGGSVIDFRCIESNRCRPIDNEIIVFIMQQIEMCFIQSFIGTFLTSLMNRTVINWIYSYFILNLQTAGFTVWDQTSGWLTLGKHMQVEHCPVLLYIHSTEYLLMKQIICF